jgi:hypothetical protein
MDGAYRIICPHCGNRLFLKSCNATDTGWKIYADCPRCKACITIEYSLPALVNLNKCLPALEHVSKLVLNDQDQKFLRALKITAGEESIV